MQKRVYIWLAVMASLIGVMTYFFLKEGGGEDRGPRYTLESFKRQWTVHSPNPKAHFGRLHKVEGGYAADYGDGVSMFIGMHKDTVTGARIRYEAVPDQGAGGPRFLLLMHTAINVGTFRWPQERLDQVRQIFNIMTPQPKIYRYLYTSFTRSYTQANGWEFVLDYVPNKTEENSEAPAQQ
ncbi:MAG: hypothetical protein FWH34_01195 [Desulfovibrionaceae bacterium]|nr:hypothetical protein [Desulfovibrionaceae bacterium]